jgi:hypothetical protein
MSSVACVCLCTQMPLTDKDKFVVLASDGVWDHLENHRVIGDGQRTHTDGRSSLCDASCVCSGYLTGRCVWLVCNVTGMQTS